MTTPLRYQLTPDDIAFCENVVCAGFHAIKFHTLQVVEDLLDDGVPGDFAECGVLYGAHPAIMLRSLLRRGIRNRKVHLFDSFQGIPRATKDDPQAQQDAYGLSTGVMESSGVSACPAVHVLRNLMQWGVYDRDLVVTHQGWFQNTLPITPPLPLALLRSDVDLFDSTKLVYQHLYGMVVPGGYVIDDDYGSPGDVTACRRALESVIGPQEVAHVGRQDTTAWWRRR